MSEEEKNKLAEYWKRFEEHVKPQSNHILNRFYLRSLKQNNRPLDEFLTEARLLIKSSGFPAELHDELMRDSLVFGAESDAVRKKCIAEGNSLTFKKAREIARTEEATRLQMKAMGNPQDQSEVNSLQNTRDQRQRKGKTHGCHNIGHFQHL